MLAPLKSGFKSNILTSQAITASKRDLILSILKSTTTKREAKLYLSRYPCYIDECQRDRLDNLPGLQAGEISLPLKRDVSHGSKSPRKAKTTVLDAGETKYKHLRLVIIKIANTGLLQNDIKGIARTIQRLSALGASPLVVIDEPQCGESRNDPMNRSISQSSTAFQLAKNISRLEGSLFNPSSTICSDVFTSKSGRVTAEPNQLLESLFHNIVPIVLPNVFITESSNIRRLRGHESLRILSQCLSMHPAHVSVEKIVIVDEFGGIPSIERDHASHVYINLKQELSDITLELHIGHLDPTVRDRHLSNLTNMRAVLQIVTNDKNANDTTGIVTSPEVMSSKDDQVNSVIYNVLTDRPIISSSLPSNLIPLPQLSTSIIKLGYEVKIFGDNSTELPFTMDRLFKEKAIDEGKLTSLIEDSFGKALNAKEYYKRIDSNLATVVVLGDYDGAAIVTWEAVGNNRIAYLDKFAIASRFQGLPSLADIIFKALLSCHKKELIWRSRLTNPVNKWYFERSRGSFVIPETPWRCFFYSASKSSKLQRGNLEDYSTIVRKIPSSFN